MPRGRDKRLRRLAARHVDTETEAWHWREPLEARLALCEVLREMLAELGIDPAQVRMLHFCDEAEAELAAGPPPALIRRENAPGNPLAQEIERLARCYRDDPAIDFAEASLISVFAWCVARLGAPEVSPDLGPPAANPLQK